MNSFAANLRCALACLAMAALPLAGASRRESFNEGWKFLKNNAAEAERPDFDDAGWRKLDLPHDWAIEGPFNPRFSPETGGLPVFGTGWYRKHFKLPASARGQCLSLEIDGAMSNSTVWINGTEIGGRPYGYSSFSVDLTPHLHYGTEENVVAIRLQPEEDASRWYPGAGLYRNVWLVTTGPIHVDHWGSYITTPRVSREGAEISVRTTVRNRRSEAASLTVSTEILDRTGKSVLQAATPLAVPATSTAAATASLSLRHPDLWDVDTPQLYRAVVTLKSGDQVVDRYETPFGIRDIQFTRDKGFWLNGRGLKLQGVCNHHDLGALGTAINLRAIERQLEILKNMGVNAIRTSHNPPAPELLDACDRMGFLVMDEAFDMWRIPKVKNGYSKYFDQWSERDLRDMIRRDRNHPSIILWSIGNEIPEQGKPEGREMARRLSAIVHEEDSTRPTTSGFNSWIAAIQNGLAEEVDVPGFNYKPMFYSKIQANHPKWIVYGSETASCVSSRGVYHLPLAYFEHLPSKQVSSYDVSAPEWAYCPDVEFEYQDQLPNVLGEFVWTGFDYLGEPTPYGEKGDWPARSSYFGIVDLAGFPKDRFYLYQSRWTNRPVLHLLPHWNWAGHEGKTIPVMAYTNAQEVELFLNGKSLGRRRLGVDTVALPVGKNVSESHQFVSKYRLAWDVPFTPGVLRSVGYRDGKQIAVDEVHTAGVPAKITLKADRSRIQLGGDDLSFVTVRIEDKDGNLCPLADNLVNFRVLGAGRIAAVDNGNAASTEPFQADHRKAFSGMALLIVRSTERAGEIRVTATSPGLKSAILRIITTR